MAPPKSKVFMSGSPVANPKSGHDYSVFIMKYMRLAGHVARMGEKKNAY
jgi:hypothetical protein